MKYQLNEKQIELLRNKGLINWIGWTNWFQFIKLKDRLSKLPFVNKDKLESLYNKIDELSIQHDIEYELKGYIIAFSRANYNFSLWTIKLLWWTSPTARFTIFILLMSWLSFFWLRYFKFWKKKTLEDLLK